MLYAITDRRLYGKDEPEARARLLEQATIWAANGVSFIQLREKDLAARDQVELARSISVILEAERSRTGRHTRLLINGRPDVAIAAGAHGVHLPSSGALTPDEVRQIFKDASSQKPVISISCHSMAEVESARETAPDCILFAPVFEKALPPTRPGESGRPSGSLPGSGLNALGKACHAARPIPVFALGGVNAQNARLCLQAGAAGVAAIRWLLEPPENWRPFAADATG
jgi:thiamine-phosphate pyrophosphorylase